jgi:hypothetical protein
VGLRTGLDAVERRKILPLPGLEVRLVGRPARSQSLYRIHHPGSFRCVEIHFNITLHSFGIVLDV